MRKKFFPSYCVIEWWLLNFPLELFSYPNFEIFQEAGGIYEIAHHCAIGEMSCTLNHLSKILFDCTRENNMSFLNWGVNQGSKSFKLFSQDVIFIWKGFKWCIFLVWAWWVFAGWRCSILPRRVLQIGSCSLRQDGRWDFLGCWGATMWFCCHVGVLPPKFYWHGWL